MNKKAVRFLSAFISTMIASTIAFAEPQTEVQKQQKNIQEQTDELNKNKNSLTDSQKKVQNLESQIETLDNTIQNLMVDIDGNKKQIASVQAEIKKTEDQLASAEKDLKDEEDIFAKRMRALYINGDKGYIEIILQSKSLNDLFENFEAVEKIVNIDKKIVSTINEKKQAINKKKSELTTKNDKLVALEKTNEDKLTQINTTKATQTTTLNQLKDNQATIYANMAKNKSQIDAANKTLTTLLAAAPKFVPSRGAVSYSGNSLLAYASQFQGIPYQWGGNGPNTFDCSGFVRYVFAHFGVNFANRTTEGMVNEGTPVSVSQLQPGDVVYFQNSGGDVHHVGIYVGNGCYINAPHTGSSVSVTPISGTGDTVIGRRMR